MLALFFLMGPGSPHSHSSILCPGPLGHGWWTVVSAPPPTPSGRFLGSIQTPSPTQSILCSHDTALCPPLMMENDVPSMALCSRCSHTWHSSPPPYHSTTVLPSTWNALPILSTVLHEPATHSDLPRCCPTPTHHTLIPPFLCILGVLGIC